jgi:hypothetical protein
MNRKRSNNVALVAAVLIAVLTLGRWAGWGYEDLSIALTAGLLALVVVLGLRDRSSGQRPHHHLSR